MRMTTLIISKLPHPYLWILLQAIVRTPPFSLLSDTFDLLWVSQELQNGLDMEQSSLKWIQT